MKAQNLRTVILANADLAVLHGLLQTLADGKPLTAAETGVTDEAAIANLSLAGETPPTPVFDGFRWVVFMFLTSG